MKRFYKFYKEPFLSEKESMRGYWEVFVGVVTIFLGQMDREELTIKLKFDQRLKGGDVEILGRWSL